MLPLVWELRSVGSQDIDHSERFYSRRSQDFIRLRDTLAQITCHELVQRRLRVPEIETAPLVRRGVIQVVLLEKARQRSKFREPFLVSPFQFVGIQ